MSRAVPRMGGWRRLAGALADSLAGYLWPSPGLCPGCGRPEDRLGDGFRFCPRCLERLPLLAPPLCRQCGKPLRLTAEEHPDCRDCRGRARDFRVARAAGLYDGELRRFLHRFKFRRERRLARPLGHLLDKVWRRHPELWGAEVVVPVPLTPERLAERGFNQAADLARVFGEAVRRPVAEDALRRRGDGEAQSRRPGVARAAGTRGVFRPFRPGTVAGRRVLLVDDVFTTGATAEACALALLEAGAVDVRVLTVATTVVTDSWHAVPAERRE
jgi:ComF family protein